MDSFFIYLTFFNGMTPLHFGAKQGFNDVVNFLLTLKGINVNAKTNSGWTPLHMSAMKGHHGISSMLASHPNTDIQARDNNGNTPLHFAAGGGYKDITGLLLSKGAKINCTNNKGWTPMHCAVDKGKQEVVSFILNQNDYDPEVKDENGLTAYERASPEIKELFMQKYPDLATPEKSKCRI